MPIRSFFISRGSNNYLLYTVSEFSQEKGIIYRNQSTISLSQFQRYREKSPRAMCSSLIFFLSQHPDKLFEAFVTVYISRVKRSTRKPEKRDDEIVALVDPSLGSRYPRNSVGDLPAHGRGVYLTHEGSDRRS